MPKRSEFDVCVVGTGAGGGVIIRELTAAGFQVVALQRGPFLQTSDFDDDELKTVVRDQVFAADQIETYRPDESTPAAAGRFTQVAHCVGGTITEWAGWAFRFRPDEFAVRSKEGPVEGASLADWPLRYDDLEPFYEKAEWDFGVAGDSRANPFAPPRAKGYPNPAHPPRAAAEIFAAAARKVGYRPFPMPLAINSRPYGKRPACLYGGACRSFGCPIHAKATTLSVSIPPAIRSRNLDLRPNATAFEVTLGEDGRARSVRYLDWKGREQEVFARHVVLAAGAIGTPHLLLMSASGSFPEGLANSSGLVGRHLTFQLHAAAGFLADRTAMGFAGAEAHAAIDDLHPSDPARGFIRGGVVAESNFATRQPIAYATLGAAGYPRMERSWGQDLKEFLRSFSRAVFLTAVLEDLPMAENRVDLDPEIKDRRGLPVPRITHRQHPNDLRMHRWFRKKLLEIAEAAGAKEKWLSAIGGVTAISEETPMAGSPHVLGTCRMGADPRKSVVDAWCRAHDVANLWVVDGSTFPTPGGYPPALTILANAYRVARRFVAEAKRGNR